jgi:LPXTG-motif cell wall-anchored protein
MAMRGATAAVIAFLLAQVAAADSEVFRQEPLWSRPFQGRISVIEPVDGGVLVGAENGVFLVDGSNVQRWYHPTGGAVTSISSVGGFIVAASDGSLLLLNESGGLEWDRHIPGYVGYDAAVDADGQSILCGSMDGFVYMLDRNGTFLWKHLVGSYVTGARIVGDTVVAVSDRQVYYLDLEGRVRRNLGLQGYIRSFAIAPEAVYVGMDDGFVYGYGLDGSLSWSRDLGEYVSAMDYDGNLTVGSKEMHLFRFGAGGGPMWALNLSDGVVAVKSGGGYVLASTLDDKVRLFNDRGVLMWFYDADGRAVSLAFGGGDDIYAGAATGRLYRSRMPQTGESSPALLAAAVLVLVGLAVFLVRRSWR